MLSTILGYVESYAAWKAGEMGSTSASNLYGTLAQIVQHSQDHYDRRQLRRWRHCTMRMNKLWSKFGWWLLSLVLASLG